jgi:hypothetical protein
MDQLHARGMVALYRSDSAVSSQDHPAQQIITVLTSANNRRATKRFTPAGVEPYARERNWRWREEPIRSFEDLFRVLAMVERDPLSLIVQGAVAHAYRDQAVIPRTKAKGVPSLVDAGSRVVHFDIDDVPLPLGTGWHAPEDVARAVWQTVIVARIPAFAGVSVWWQASSSAGTPGKAHLAKLHFWALLDQPIDEAARKALLRAAGADDSLSTINQPNYVAAPIFDGVPDPLRDVARSGVLRGQHDAASVEAIAWPEARIRAARGRKPTGAAGPTITPEGLHHATTDAGRAILARACAQIEAATHGARNKLINRVAYTIGGHVAGGAIAYAEAREALLRAGAASGHDRYVEAVENGLRDGLQRPIASVDAAVDDAREAVIAPHHAAPQADRAAAISGHSTAIIGWGDINLRIMQATRAVARAYAAEIVQPSDDDPDREARLLANKKARLAIRRSIKADYGLDYLPTSRITADTPFTRVMVAGAQGVGKTRAVVGAGGRPGILHHAHGLVSAMFEPDHAMAAQARGDYDANAPRGAPPSIVLRGRAAADPDLPGETMCRLHIPAGKLAAKGVSVPKALCERCPFAGACAYLRQEREIIALATAPDGVVIFATHDYAFLPMPGLIVPDLAIFDERPRDYAVEEAQASFEMLGEPLRFDRPVKPMNAAQAESEAADAHAALMRYVRPLMIAVRDAGQNDPDRILGALRDRGITAQEIDAAIVGIKMFTDHQTAHAVRDVLWQHAVAKGDGRPFNLEARLAAEIGGREEKIARAVQGIFEALRVEIDKSRDDAVGVGVGNVRRRPGSKERGPGIIAVRIRQHRLGHAPFLHLDGTGDHAMAQRIFGAMDLVHHSVERSPAERGDKVTQVVGADFHNAGLVGGRKGPGGEIVPYHGTWKAVYDAQRAAIIKAIKARPGALVVGNKAVIEALQPAALGAHAAHFGALRGRNDWERLDCVMIVGREEPAPSIVERIARAFAAHDDAPFASLAGNPYPKVQRGIRMRDGTGRAIRVTFHPNDWADRVLSQIREAEIVQAIDRLRPIFKDKPIEVVLLSPVAVDLTVDQVVAWNDWLAGGTRIERALATARVVPLSAREAVRLLPAIWGSRGSARRDLEEDFLSAQIVNRDLYLRFGPIRTCVVAAYQAEAAPGRRAHEHKALIAAAPGEARTVLEALTGPLRHFEVVRVIEPDPDVVAAAEDAAYAREERIAIAMDSGMTEAEAIRIADDVRIAAPCPPRPKPAPAAAPPPRAARG